jgi:hypothetical protein
MSICRALEMAFDSHLSSVMPNDSSTVALNDLVELLRAEVASLDPGRELAVPYTGVAWEE